MELTINNTTIDLTNKDGKVFANTKDIADVFEKRNSAVMEKIKSLPDYEELLAEPKIGVGFYTDENNQQREMIELDRDIFSVIVMGFTGDKAYKWIRAYIEAFNRMEQELLNPKQLTPIEQAYAYMDVMKVQIADEKKKTAQIESLRETSEKIIDSMGEQVKESNIGLQELCSILTSRTTEVAIGRTTLYMILRSMKLIVADGRKPTSYGSKHYLDYRLGEHGYSTRVLDDKVGKLTTAIVKHLLNNDELNSALGYPFHPELRE
jgi:Rha family phage regulatory protein